MPSLFSDTEETPSQAARLAPRLHKLAEEGIYFGTSSWKYQGWLGSIYSPDRYQTRGKVSKKKFEDTCLAEYARTFPTVCGDFALAHDGFRGGGPEGAPSRYNRPFPAGIPSARLLPHPLLRGVARW